MASIREQERQTDEPRPLDLAQSPARESVGFLLAHAAHRFRLLAERELQPLGLEIRHFGILATIQHFGPVPQQQLVVSVCIDRSTMVNLIDDLEAAGLVVRRPDPSDRRAHRVHLTDSGGAVFARAAELIRRCEEQTLSALSGPEQVELKRMLAILGDLDGTSGFEHISIRTHSRASGSGS